MPHRIDVELTSDRGDGTWTWRAAGARQPKGVVAADLLQSSPKVGDVLRAEVEMELDGITVLSVVPPRQRQREEPERLELLGPARSSEPAVSVSSSGRRGARGETPSRRASPRRTPGGPSPDGEDRGVGDGRRPRRAGRGDAGPDRRSRGAGDTGTSGARSGPSGPGPSGPGGVPAGRPARRSRAGAGAE
ncbi:MAG: hypothetical protein J2P59_10405, partial [Acidimicrobiales bacterium]|nr:hypothetical protein [Acidimicrobiales bacterium]